jgi:hypothetical protein
MARPERVISNDFLEIMRDWNHVLDAMREALLKAVGLDRGQP